MTPLGHEKEKIEGRGENDYAEFSRGCCDRHEGLGSGFSIPEDPRLSGFRCDLPSVSPFPQWDFPATSVADERIVEFSDKPNMLILMKRCPVDRRVAHPVLRDREEFVGRIVG